MAYYRPTVNWSSVDRVLTDYQLGCPSSIDQDIDQGYRKLSIDIQLRMLLVHKIHRTYTVIYKSLIVN